MLSLIRKILCENSCQCQKCPLGQSRNKFVFGVGDPNASLLLVGEAPGAEEDKLGEPFIGRAGKLLDKILAAIGRNRQKDVYICNVMKCRPPNNRDPLRSEVDQCEPYLLHQIHLIKPKLIVALGRVAGQTLLNVDKSLKRSEEHTSELLSRTNLVCRLRLEKKNKNKTYKQ